MLPYFYVIPESVQCSVLNVTGSRKLDQPMCDVMLPKFTSDALPDFCPLPRLNQGSFTW